MRRQLTLRRVDLAQVEALYDQTVQLPDDYSRDGLDRLFETVFGDDLKVLQIDSPEMKADIDPKEEEQQPAIPCEACSHVELCHGKTDRHFNRLLALFRNSRERR